MRHRVTTKKLGRDAAHRKALVFNLCKSLIENGGINTTVAKAKYVKPFIEKLVTRAKRKESLSNNRILLSRLNNDGVLVEKLVSDIAKRYQKRPGGFLSIQKANKRDGDKSTMARISWVKVALVKEKETDNKDSDKKTKVVEKSKKVEVSKKKVVTKKATK
ncbi:50S ribosomal protein L17 [bacterium]|nr:50S ribosomal protein L17 [bacterium]